VTGWQGLFLPKDTPDPIVQHLNQALSAALDLPFVRERFKAIGEDAAPGERRSSEYFAKFVASEIDKWSRPIKASGVCWAMARLSILFPAIAVDAPGATLSNVLADTRGYGWQIFLIGLLASLPIGAVHILFRLLVRRGTVMEAVVDAALGIVSATLLVVIASRLYQRLGNNVDRTSAV
jgi:hypothetical protein